MKLAQVKKLLQEEIYRLADEIDPKYRVFYFKGFPFAAATCNAMMSEERGIKMCVYELINNYSTYIQYQINRKKIFENVEASVREEHEKIVHDFMKKEDKKARIDYYDVLFFDRLNPYFDQLSSRIISIIKLIHDSFPCDNQLTSEKGFTLLYSLLSYVFRKDDFLSNMFYRMTKVRALFFEESFFKELLNRASHIILFEGRSAYIVKIRISTPSNFDIQFSLAHAFDASMFIYFDNIMLIEVSNSIFGTLGGRVYCKLFIDLHNIEDVLESLIDKNLLTHLKQMTAIQKTLRVIMQL